MKLCYAYFVFFLFCIPSVIFGQDRKQNSFFFIQLSDPQLGFYSQGSDFSREREQMMTFIEAINLLKPAFVVISAIWYIKKMMKLSWPVSILSVGKLIRVSRYI